MARIGEKWPETLDVFGETWKVKLSTVRTMGKKRNGYYDLDERTIHIWIGLRGRAKWRVLLHEMMHIAYGHANGKAGVPRELEELAIRALTDGPDVSLYDLLNRNFGFGPRERGEE